MVIVAVTAAAVVIPVADALRVAPLASRDGVVLTWRAQNKTAVIAQPSGKLLAIHALRRVSPGSRVTVSGIKWGSPVSGIKWSAAPSGIKWGIKWSRNGSYQSGISTRRNTKKAVWTPVRGPIVKKFGRKAVAVGTPGGVVVVRIAALRRGSEGLPGQKELTAGGLPPVGATISIRVYFAKNGIKVGRDLKYLKPPIPGASLPIAGSISSLNVAAKTMVVVDDQDRAYPVRITVALPPEFTIAPYPLGTEVAVSGVIKSNGVMSSTLVSENGNFRQADDPTTTQILPGGGACANALDNACPQTTPGTPESGSLGQTPAGGPVVPPSTSPSTPPTPPSGGTPPGDEPAPPAGDPTPPGGDPGTDPPDGDDLPPACRPAPDHGRWNAPSVTHRPARCWQDWCKVQRRSIGKGPVGCSPGRPWHRHVTTSRHR